MTGHVAHGNRQLAVRQPGVAKVVPADGIRRIVEVEHLVAGKRRALARQEMQLDLASRLEVALAADKFQLGFVQVSVIVEPSTTLTL